jgi:hypothetical protein
MSLQSTETLRSRKAAKANPEKPYEDFPLFSPCDRPLGHEDQGPDVLLWELGRSKRGVGTLP